MDTEPRRDSAKIYRFPQGGRSATQSHAKPKPATFVTAPSGRGWYHDVAIRDAGKGKAPDLHE